VQITLLKPTSITTALQEIESRYTFSSLVRTEFQARMLIVATNVGLFHCRGYIARAQMQMLFVGVTSTELVESIDVLS
jgi:hypothetical protein